MNDIDISDSTINSVEKNAQLDIQKPKRWVVFDYIRAIGIIIIIFIHSAIYQYGLLTSIDIENLNPFFMIMYIILNWAGMFALLSAVVNSYSSFYRLDNNFQNKIKNPAWNAFGKRWIFLGFFFLLLNFLYTFLVSPMNIDFETLSVSYSFLPGIIRTGHFYSVSATKMLHGSIFTMLGWNLIIMGIVFTIVFRKQDSHKKQKNKFLILILGILIVLVSFVRIYLYDYFTTSIQNGNYILAYFIDVLAGSYFPILPYLGFGFIGSYLGFTLADNPTKVKLRRLIWIGVGWFVIALIAFFIPDSVYASIGLLDDIFFDYIIVMAELGFFIIVGLVLILVSFNKETEKDDIVKNTKSNISSIFLRFSTNSLTFFFLERPISELFALLLNTALPGWNNYIWTCLLFGLFMVLFWFIIAFIWNFVDFKGSFEWFLVKLFKLTRYETNKKF